MKETFFMKEGAPNGKKGGDLAERTATGKKFFKGEKVKLWGVYLLKEGAYKGGERSLGGGESHDVETSFAQMKPKGGKRGEFFS